MKIKKLGRPYKFRSTWPLSTIALFMAVVSLVGYQSNQLQVTTAHASQVMVMNTKLEEERNQAIKETEQWRENFELEVSKVFTDKKAEDWKQFTLMAKAVAPIMDYPVNVLLSQAALESARGTSRWATERNNYFGYTCYDNREFESCSWFASPYESMLEYMRLIKNKYPKAYAARHNPDLMIQEIKNRGYATDPNYVTKVKSMPEWKIK